MDWTGRPCCCWPLQACTFSPRQVGSPTQLHHPGRSKSAISKSPVIHSSIMPKRFILQRAAEQKCSVNRSTKQHGC